MSVVLASGTLCRLRGLFCRPDVFFWFLPASTDLDVNDYLEYVPLTLNPLLAWLLLLLLLFAIFRMRQRGLARWTR